MPASISTSAAAPSEMEEELAAVTVPSLLNAGFMLGIFSTSQVPGVSSRAITVSPLRPFTVRGATSVSNSPPCMARMARRTDSVANASCWARVKPYLLAVASAKQPIDLPSKGLCRPSRSM